MSPTETTGLAGVDLTIMRDEEYNYDARYAELPSGVVQLRFVAGGREEQLPEKLRHLADQIDPSSGGDE